MKLIFWKIIIVFFLLSVLPAALSFYSEHLQLDWFFRIFVVFLFLLFLIFLSGVFVKQRITRPISDLTRCLKEVSKGNFGVKFEIKSNDELKQLSLIFNEAVLKLKEEREREAMLAKLKTEFLSIAAHQLRTPLSLVKWILNMVLEGDLGKLPPSQADFLRKGYTANERMIHLVNDLLDVARIEEGRFGFDFVKSDFNEFIINIVDSFGGQAAVKNVEIKYQITNNPVPLVFDSSRLGMAMSNLIDNAIRYTPPRGKVVIVVEPRDDFVQVSVSDTGVGISKRQQYKVFSKFFRGDNVVKMQTDGTGLGLFLVKNIIEKHGGKIWFESKENEGTIFYFTLPFERKIL